MATLFVSATVGAAAPMPARVRVSGSRGNTWLSFLSARKRRQKWDGLHRAVPSSHGNMSAEVTGQIQLEIAHVLFIGVVSYSKLSLASDTQLSLEVTHIPPADLPRVFKTEAPGLQK